VRAAHNSRATSLNLFAALHSHLSD